MNIDDTTDVRKLDRPLDLLRRGRITYEQWVEAAAAWKRGEDIDRRDFGDAEALSARITRSFNEPVSPTEVSYLLGVSAGAAATALSRMVKRGQAQRISHGAYVVQGPPTKKVPT